MTKEERIQELKTKIMYIEAETDYMTSKDWDAVRKFKAQIKEIEASDEAK